MRGRDLVGWAWQAWREDKAVIEEISCRQLFKMMGGGSYGYGLSKVLNLGILYPGKDSLKLTGYKGWWWWWWW